MKKGFLLPLILIILIAAFVRLYRINDYMHFLGDEGRDALVVKRMVVDLDPTFIGPITSVGNIYLGPIYYYFMTPFMILSGMNPVGPAIMIALMSLGTIILLYKIGYEYFDRNAAIISSLLYALSPFVIIYSRFSWNPNAVPFFALLIIYSLIKVIADNEIKWLWLTGLSLGIILQLHYISLMFVPIIILSLLVYRKLSLKNIFILIISFVIPLIPYLAFEFHNNFPNITTAIRFVTKSGPSATFAFTRFGGIIKDLTYRAFLRLVVIEGVILSWLLMFVVISSVITIFIKDKKYIKNKAFIIILLWYGVSIIIFGFYKGAIYDYYMVQFLPFPALIIGIVFAWLIKKRTIGKILAVVLFSLILGFQLKNSPLKKEPNKLLSLTRERASFILDKTQGKPYNFALITGSNSDHAYRYFLELWGGKPVEILNPELDPDRGTVTDQLFIVCESDVCQPLGHPLWEIAGFGMAEIDQTWEVSGTKIIKLVPYKESEIKND